MQDSRETIETLREIARDRSSKGHGARLRKALLLLAVPATALFATACYGMPMPPEGPQDHNISYGEPIELEGVDCDGDGQIDAPTPEGCQQALIVMK